MTRDMNQSMKYGSFRSSIDEIGFEPCFSSFFADLFQTPTRSKQKPDELAHILHGLFSS